MDHNIFNYQILPSVVRADAETEVRIRPLGENVAFGQGVTYAVTVTGTETATASYAAFPTASYECVPNGDGELVFSHFFADEQKHIITFTRPKEDLATPHTDLTYRERSGANRDAVLAVYSLRSDLYGLRAFKGELHCHTFESDGMQDVCHTVGNYRSGGYDFLAITDHYISLSAEKAKRIFASAPVEMTLMLGEEVHVPTERIHAVHVGGSGSVNEVYRRDGDKAYAEVAEIESTIEADFPADRNDYAWRVWIAQKAREAGGIAILAHPHWIWENVYFMSTATTKKLLRDGVYDALDLTDSDVDASAALWNDLRSEGCSIPIVGSSDSHYTDAGDMKRPAKGEGGYTVVFAPDRSEKSLLEAICIGRSVAVNAKGYPEFIHGTFRLVKFTKFLLKHFYPTYMRLCAGQGVILSEYPADGSVSDKTEEALEVLSKRSERFASEFYGYK